MKVKCKQTSELHGLTAGKEYEVVKERKKPNSYLVKLNRQTSVWAPGLYFHPVIDGGFRKFIDKCDLTGMEQYQ